MLQGEKCVIWNYDVFGFEGGRTRQLCDTLAEKGNFFSPFCLHEIGDCFFPPGYLVILPDWYRGKLQDPAEGPEKLVPFIKAETKWDVIKSDWQKKVRPFAEKSGAKVFGTVGTCWGSVPVLRLCGEEPGMKRQTKKFGR